MPSSLTSSLQDFELTSFYHKGRTARIGNLGIATSFYNEKDEELAPDLVKILLECQQEVPDFLEAFAPPDNVPVFEDEAEPEAEGNNDGSGREYREPQTTTIETNPQGEQSESGPEQPAPTTEDQWNAGGASSNGMGESQWAPAGNDSW